MTCDPRRVPITATWPPIIDAELRRAFVMNESIDPLNPALDIQDEWLADHVSSPVRE